jgi:hypothetical protein
VPVPDRCGFRARARARARAPSRPRGRLCRKHAFFRGLLEASTDRTSPRARCGPVFARIRWHELLAVRWAVNAASRNPASTETGTGASRNPSSTGRGTRAGGPSMGHAWPVTGPRGRQHGPQLRGSLAFARWHLRCIGLSDMDCRDDHYAEADEMPTNRRTPNPPALPPSTTALSRMGWKRKTIAESRWINVPGDAQAAGRAVRP